MIDGAEAMLGVAAMLAAAPQSDRLAERFLAGAARQPAARPGERVVSGEALVPVTVNGTPLRLRIEPGLPGMILVAPALKEPLGLKAGGLFGIGVCYRFGRETTCGGTKVTRLGWAGEKPQKRRIGWMSRPYQPPADGTVGPAGVPEAVVRFALHPPRAGEETAVLPMQGGTGLFGGWFVLDGTATIGGAPMRLRFDPHHPRSLVNAAAAVALAASHGGTMTAETGRQEIAFGIERPYRVMKLARPIAIGGLTLASVGVRVTDGDLAGRIAEEGAAPEAADPDEVVVTARKGKPRTGLMILGGDALAACSSLVFDKAARQIRLTCGGGQTTASPP